jgi:hypothetical protein
VRGSKCSRLYSRTKGGPSIPFLDILPNFGRLQLVLGKRGGKIIFVQVISVHFGCCSSLKSYRIILLLQSLACFLWSQKMSTTMSRSLFSGSTPSQTSHFRRESQSQSNPAPISPTTEARMSPMQIPHSLRRPAAKPKHQAQVIDKANSKIPAPPGNNYGEFLEWLGHYFALYFSEEFECFLLEEMKILSIQELSHFLTNLEPKVLHDSLGPVIYDRFRQSIIDLQVIWSFLKKSYSEGQSYASYSAFLSYHKDTTRKVTASFPGSMAYIKPSLAYKPVMPADKTTWKSEFWCGQKRSVITTTKPWLKFGCLCEQHSGPLV